MPTLTIIKPGSPVTIGDDISAIVIGVQISIGNYIQYQVAWWNDNERLTDWLESAEVTSGKEAERVSIGFQ